VGGDAADGLPGVRQEGTGPGGRIVEADIQALLAKGPAVRQTAPTDKPSAERVPMAGLRRSLAERLRNTLSTAASTTLTREADADLLVAVRKSLAQKLGEAPSFDALFIKIFAAALRERPELNAILESDTIVRLSEINIGFAVAVPNGLIVPVMRDVANRDTADLRRGLNALKTDVRARKVPLSELRGQTITLSNFGMFAGRYAALTIVPPQVAILGAGRARATVVPIEGKPTVRQMLPLSLTFDHRVVSGGEAARFLGAVIGDLEKPT
jgi:pyruvate dehydrogenase E2 component (dihydrolipoamide acetyltransferase)